MTPWSDGISRRRNEQKKLRGRLKPRSVSEGIPADAVAKYGKPGLYRREFLWKLCQSTESPVCIGGNSRECCDKVRKARSVSEGIPVDAAAKYGKHGRNHDSKDRP